MLVFNCFKGGSKDEFMAIMASYSADSYSYKVEQSKELKKSLTNEQLKGLGTEVRWKGDNGGCPLQREPQGCFVKDAGLKGACVGSWGGWHLHDLSRPTDHAISVGTCLPY